jgi:hypothetical protein
MDGYVVEGHVPADVIKHRLKGHPFNTGKHSVPMGPTCAMVVRSSCMSTACMDEAEDHRQEVSTFREKLEEINTRLEQQEKKTISKTSLFHPSQGVSPHF